MLARRDGVEPALAAEVARIAQGHIGRARALARNESARERRRQVLAIPSALTSLGACLRSAAELVDAAATEASAITSGLDEQERAKLNEALGFGTKGARPRNAQAALRELEDQQKARAKRLQRDALDRVLTEFTSLYRDVLAVQTGSGAALVNLDLADQVDALARSGDPTATIRRLDAILACRTALETNVAPLLAFEALLLSLARPS